jgi:hypothetical protein
MIDNFVEDLMKITWYVVMILGCWVSWEVNDEEVARRV